MLATIASFQEPWEAHLFRLRLEAEGILAVVSHQHHVYMNWPWSQALGGVKVQVPTSAKDAAVLVWDRCLAGDFEKDLADVFGSLDLNSCPTCGSRNFRCRPTLVWIGFLVAVWFGWGVIFPPPRSVCRCAVCGEHWSSRA
jgi:hypothetical protein